MTDDERRFVEAVFGGCGGPEAGPTGAGDDVAPLRIRREGSNPAPVATDDVREFVRDLFASDGWGWAGGPSTLDVFV